MVLSTATTPARRQTRGDRRLVANPCEGSRLPKAEKRQIVPLTTEEVRAVTEAAPDVLKALVTLAAGSGVRQGECLGLTVDRLDMLRQELTVDRQLHTAVGKRPHLGPPKTAASVPTIPLPQVVVDALAANIAAHSVGIDGLVFSFDSEPISRPRPRLAPCCRGGEGRRGNWLPRLRHYYASLLIRHGESVKTVQARLGHASAVETLDTYSHLWPDSDDRTREAIDSVLGAPETDDADASGQ